MRARMALASRVCTLCIAVLACGSGRLPCTAQSVPEKLDLATRLRADRQNDALRQHVSVTRKGRRVDATVLIAPVTAQASLAGLSGRYILELTAAPAFNIGDGMQMDLTLSDAGGRRPIYSRYFDAGRKAEDRDWQAIEVPLALSGSSGVYLEIKVTGGPQGDMVADWLAFAEVLLVRVGDSR